MVFGGKMNKLIKLLKNMNTVLKIVVFLKGLFWVVLSCCCVYGINTNKDFMEMFFLIYFSEITIVLLINWMKGVAYRLTENAMKLLFEMEEEEYLSFSEIVAHVVNIYEEGSDKKYWKYRKIRTPLGIVFENLKSSSLLFNNIILAKCKKAKINIKEWEIL